MKVLAVCTGSAQPIAAKSGKTGHFKTPQAGAVRIGPLGLEGDTIVDVKHHGGPEQAVYIFGQGDLDWWAQELDRPLPAGYFGENLLIEGLASADLALGDILEVGALRLQITAPRIPCVTFNARISDPNGVKMFLASGRPGAYARVLRPGDVSAWDSVTHVAYEGDRITIPDHLAAYSTGAMDDDYLRRALTIPAHSGLHDLARARLKDDR